MHHLKKKLQTLNTEQLNLFLQQQGKAKIIDILFAALQHRFMTMTNIFQYDDKFIIEMIKNMTKVIQTRSQHSSKDAHTKQKNTNTYEQKQNNQNHIHTELLNVLTNPIITKVASYLDLINLLNYEQLNRNIFIISRSFHKTTYLTSRDFEKCLKFSTRNNKSKYNWYRFKNVKCVSLNCPNIVRHYCNYNPDRYTSLNPVIIDKNIDLQPFLTAPIWTTIERLHISKLSRYISSFEDQLLMGVHNNPNNFSNLKYLDIQTPNYYKASLLFKCPELLKKLEGITFHRLHSEKIFNQLNPNLKSFHGNLYTLQQLQTHKKTQKLQEICLYRYWGNDNNLHKFTKWHTLDNLQRISISGHQYSIRLFNEMLKPLIYLRNLEYLCITLVTTGQWRFTLELLANIFKHCKKFKMYINIKYAANIHKSQLCHPTCNQDLHQLVLNLIANVNDFVLSLNSITAKACRTPLNWDTSKYHGKCNTIKVTDYHIDITTKNSKIYPNTPKWLMKCRACNCNQQ